MDSAPCRLAIVSFAIALLAIVLDCARAEECDYKRCGALMARDGSASWGLSGPRDYSPDTKRACAELNACLRRVKNNPAERAAAAPASGSSSKSSPKESAAKESVTNLNAEPAEKAAKVMQPAATSTVRENSGPGFPNADHSNGKPTRCFAVAEILVAVDCPPGGPQ